MGGNITDTSAARRAIEQATSLAEIKALRDKLSPLAEYAHLSGKSRVEINELSEAKVEAECKGGLLLRDIDRSKGGRPSENSSQTVTSYQETLSEVGLNHMTAHRWQVMSYCPDGERFRYYAKTKEDPRKTINSADVYRLGLKHKPHDTEEPEPIEPGKYSCLVIDPPWVMQKIEREERINQAGFDYPTMTEEELANPDHPKWRGCPPQAMSADDAHLYCWTTHKHLPSALRLIEVWGFKYECLMTWVKNVGFTPFSWMRSTEHVLFCRRGSLPLLRVGMRLDFNAKVREHSRKPDEFYDIVKEASSGPRIDVFSRESRDGFDQWGNQSKRFAEAV